MRTRMWCVARVNESRSEGSQSDQGPGRERSLKLASESGSSEAPLDGAPVILQRSWAATNGLLSARVHARSPKADGALPHADGGNHSLCSVEKAAVDATFVSISGDNDGPSGQLGRREQTEPSTTGLRWDSIVRASYVA